MPLIAVRNSLQATPLFFRQISNLVQYSQDGVNWFNGFLLPDGVAGGSGSGGGSSFYNFEKTINTYTRKYYQETNIFDLLISLFNKPTTRQGAVESIDKMEDSVPSKKAICQASYALILGLRSVITDARNGNLEESPEVQGAKTGADIVSAGAGIGGLIVGANPVGLTLIGIGIAVAIAKNILTPAVLESAPDLTDEQVESIACCLYEAMKEGNTNYEDFASAGCDLPAFTWADFATPEVYAGFLAMIDNGADTGKCPCEECIEAYPADATILRGQALRSSLMTTTFNTGGNVWEMQAQCTFSIPLMTVTSIEVTTVVKSYENVANPTPMVSFNASGTGGGNTAVPEGAGITKITPAQLPLINIDNFTLNLRASICASCTTAQTAVYNDSYGAIIKVVVCGILA